MNVIVYHGSQTSRNMLAEYEMFYKDEEGQKLKNVFKFHVLITTYECLIQVRAWIFFNDILKFKLF